MIDRVAEEYLTEDFVAYKTEKEDENKEKPRCTAIILAAGSGSRMHSVRLQRLFSTSRKAVK